MAGGEEQENMEVCERAGPDSSDDDIEIVPKSVDNFWLEYGDETPVSFATLPYFKLGEEPASDRIVFVRGTQDNGMRLYMRGISWKLELTKDMKPTFHLKTEKYWIQLLKPRKSYEDSIRSVMSVAQFLNFALVNPDASEKAAWSHVNETFPSWELSASRNDLSLHPTLFRHLVASDERLAAAFALQSLDIGVSKKRLASATEDGRQGSRKGVSVSGDEGDGGVEVDLQPEPKKGKFEVGDLNSEEEMDGYGGEEPDADEEVSDLSETVCCICDNGGTVICCDGPCMRSFHLNKGAGGAEDSHCSTLGFSKAEAERMEKFFCPNCKFKKHQCYACGKLGLSDESAGAAQEVFVCDAAMCGHFYHPSCIAALILRDKDSSEQEALAESIKDKKGFVCTMHKCWKCDKGEDKKDKDLQFGVCRRCPRVWHRKCLPFSPPADNSEDEEDSENENDEPQRAWDGLLPNRLLVYCTRHTIISSLGTPARNHVKFPEGSLPTAKKAIKSKPEDQERKSKLIKLSSRKDTSSSKSGVGQKTLKLDDSKKKKQKLSLGLATKSKLDRDGTIGRVSTSMASEKKPGPFLIKGRGDIAKKDGSSSKLLSLSKSRLDTDAKFERSGSIALKSSTPKESMKSKPPVVAAVVIDNQTKSMVNDIIEKTKTLVTIESVLQKHDIPACYRRNSRNPDKKYSLFKIESITKGMRKALETLETGGNIEDAKVKCSPDLIRFIELCRNDLRVYLSPFLHGARYTSYGRHFTKSEKLEEIVDRLHCYVEKGDMVVDFCCGANEFSLFMRRKLEETDKKCEYKNFDLIQTKNDFNFSKRDWFQVSPEELPDGNRLIMGLNPPFGAKGHLANQFIDHALKFRPKLVVLIVPKETERLDQKLNRYDLVWEDVDLLAGQSFYLPGSVDVDEKPLNDWNVVAPPLYLWSRPDWTSRHKEVAVDNGHISAVSSSRYAGCPWKPTIRPSSPSLLLDTVVDNVVTLTETIEFEEKEEKKSISYKTIDELSGVQEARPKLDRSSSAKSKDLNKKTREPTETKLTDGSASKTEGRGKDNTFSNLNAKTPPKSFKKDGPVLEKRQEVLEIRQEVQENGREMPKSHREKPENRVEGPLDSSKKISEGSLKHQNISKGAKVGELPKRKGFEGQDHAHAQRTDKLKASSQESPDTTRRSSETRYDLFKKDRKSNDRSDRGDDPRVDPTHDVQWKRAPEKHRQSTEADMGGRRSPIRHDKYESGRRNSPEKYDRYGANRYGEDRRASPERARHSSMGNEPRRGSPDKLRYSSSVVDHDLRRVSPDKSRYTSSVVDHDLRRVSPEKSLYTVDHELRRVSPEKSRHSSSVVDLDTLFSSSDAKKDQSRGGYDDYMRKSTGKDYQDTAFYREGSPNRRYGFEDSKRSWVNMDSYQGASEVFPRASDTAYMTSSYDGMARYRAQKAEAQMNPLGRHYTDHETLGAHRQDAYGVQMPRQTDFYPSDRLGGTQGLSSVNYRDDRYGAPLRTEDPFRASLGGGLGGVLPERSFQSAWSGSLPPPVASYNVAYGGSQLQQQPPVDPLLLSSRGLVDSRLAQAQSNRSQYPPSLDRLSGQGRQPYAGGWFND